MFEDLNEEGLATMRCALLTARRVWREQSATLHTDGRHDTVEAIDKDLAILNNIFVTTGWR